jgi:hypothetical protein
MLINTLLFIFFVFVIRFFFFLAKKYNKSLFLYSLSGFLFFLIAYFLVSFISGVFFSFLLKSSTYVNELIISCFTIPLALVVSAVHYRVTENRFKKNKKESNINDIGKHQ